MLISSVKLMRLDRPIGIYLLLWPTLWALMLASGGHPPIPLLIIFVLGTVLMRSAGCVINDIADREFDPHVHRTHTRPLAQQTLSVSTAWALFLILLGLAFILVYQLDISTIKLSSVAVMLAAIYPFTKRVTHFPQLFLGAAFAWGIPMAYMAIRHRIPWVGWILYLAGVLWPLAYDTVYAMSDAVDDIQVGIKSTAIFFGRWTFGFVVLVDSLFLIVLIVTGIIVRLQMIYFFSLGVAGVLLGYQCYLIKQSAYFKAFLSNNYVGFVITLGVFLNYVLSK